MHQHVLDDGFYVLLKLYSNYMDTLMHDSYCQTRTVLPVQRKYQNITNNCT